MLSPTINSSHEEKAISEILPILVKFINPKYKIIKHINKIFEYHDDPKFFHFGAVLQPISNDPKEENLSNSAGGYSFFSEDEALLKCLGEALERHCLRNYDKSNLVTSTYLSLSSKAIDPKVFINFSNAQREKRGFEMFNFNDSTMFSWIKGFDLINERTVFIPAQLVYLSYKLNEGEKWIYLPISIGAAGGSSVIATIVRGIYEIIERDAFLIFYLNKLSGMKIDLHSIADEKIKFCIKSIESYNLKLYCFEITAELRIPTFLSMVIDETGIGPAVSLGLRANLDPQTAILGSIQEALHSRGWIRRKVEDNPGILKKVKRRHIETLEDRALLWYSKKNIIRLNSFLKQPKMKVKFKKNNYSFLEQLKSLLKTLKINNMNVFFVDVTLPIIQKAGYHVVKVLIPELQPFYLIEDFPYCGGERLYQVPKRLGLLNHETSEKSLNKFPHPFL